MSLAERSKDVDSLFEALEDSSIEELVITHSGENREVDEAEEFWVIPDLLERLPGLKKLSFRLTFWDDYGVPSSFERAMGTLRPLVSLTIIGDFDLLNTNALALLHCPLEELVVTRGVAPISNNLLLLLRKFRGTIKRVRAGKDSRDPFEGEALREWCGERGVELKLVEEDEWEGRGMRRREFGRTRSSGIERGRRWQNEFGGTSRSASFSQGGM